jgi:hypothetical protein
MSCCSRCACVAQKDHARERTIGEGGGVVKRAVPFVVCVHVCDFDSLVIL